MRFLFSSKSKYVKTFQISLLAFAASWLIYGLGGLEPLRRWSFAVVSTLREARLFGGAEVKPSPLIVLCAIDEESIRRVGMWPWPRSTYAKLIRQLAQDGPAAIGFNVLLPERDPTGPGNDLELATQITKSRRTVLPCIVTLRRGLGMGRHSAPPDIYPLPDFQQGAAAIGFVNIAEEVSSNKVILCGRDMRDKPVLSFPLAVFGVFARQEVQFTPNSAVIGDLRIPLEGEGLFWVDYPRAASLEKGYPGPVIPAYQVLNGNFVRGAFAGKIVLIGRADRASGDFYITPVGQLAAIELFGYVLNTILRRSFFHSIGILWDALLLFVLIFLTVTVTQRFRVMVSLMLAAEAVLGIAVLAAVLFARHHAIMNFPLMFMGIVLSFAFTEIYTLFIRERELSTLGIYMSPEVRRKILDSPQQMSVRGERKVVTVLFADIRGFTRFSHRLDPAATVALLNSYFTAMVEVITRPGHDGTIDKLVGDGIVAVFGDPYPFPDHAKRALRAAIEMQKRFTELKRTWIPYVKKIAPKYDMNKMQLGIGVATGEVVVGNVGAPALGFMSYTVIGDPANRAASLQDIAAGGQILFDEETHRQAGNSFHAKDLGEHTLKGLKMHMYLIGPARSDR